MRIATPAQERTHQLFRVSVNIPLPSLPIDAEIHANKTDGGKRFSE